MNSDVIGNVLAAPHFRADLAQFHRNRIALAGCVQHDDFGNTSTGVFGENVEISRPVNDNSLWFQSRSGCRHFGRITGVALHFHFERRLGDIQAVVTNLDRFD